LPDFLFPEFAMLDIDSLFPAMPAPLRTAFAEAPKGVLQVMAKLNESEPLAASDSRFVESAVARSSKFRQKLFSKLGYDPVSGDFVPPEQGKHLLFYGHVGCGKSTELRHLCTELHGPQRYWVVQVDLIKMLDPNNVRYCDVWLAVAQRIIEEAAKNPQIKIADVALQRLFNWFKEIIKTNENVRELAGELKTEVEAGYQIPLIAKLLTKFTASFKMGNTHREMVREVVNNNYGEFIGALNQVLASLCGELRRTHNGYLPLVWIDGCDRFRGDDWRRFFLDEGNQITQANCVTIYTAPLALKHHGRPLAQFDFLVLPMVKLQDFDTRAKLDAAYQMMREFLLKRCHFSMFADVATLDQLIFYSGGNLRDALRLLRLCCESVEQLPINGQTVEDAACQLASEFRSWLTVAQYAALAECDLNLNMGQGEIINQLIEQGVLMEYNTGAWRQAHPVLHKLKPFITALAQRQPV
jgi:hypothetical protein